MKGTIILDVGSGLSIPDFKAARDILASIHNVDSGKHTIVIKAQLFKNIPPNEPLRHEVFSWMKGFAMGCEYNMTASVFDLESLVYLLQFDIPFVKIAAPEKYRYLIGKVPRGIPIFASNLPTSSHDQYAGHIDSMACISKYPSTLEDYERIPNLRAFWGISDHTVGWELYDKYRPQVLEKHFCLERSPENPDAGAFAVTPEKLKEIM